MLKKSTRIYLEKVAKKFFPSDSLLPTFIGAIVLSVVGNSTTQLLFNTFGNGSLAVIGIAIGVIIVIFLLIGLIARLLSSPKVGLKLDKSPPLQKRGLILLVSNIESCKQAIRYHGDTLERCWLICSEQSCAKAKELEKWIEDFAPGHTKILVEVRIADDVYDPREFYQSVYSIYSFLPNGWAIDDVISDFTGMTAQASIGMAIACMTIGSELQYTPAQMIDGKPTGESLQPIAVTHKKSQFPQLP
jgi:CRISPR-associated protein (Cas_Cas02710)